ncbi:Hypp7928 [Branchiostoma lanceolatum]|uniref:Hypp7928 protein n=1 Tax=Branchiostoma lanceolatum TaxID=7740 RepID=A0A8K0ED54_BRALA|nr:Hypp7928 [Branchiostoma lanceolatum]
MVTTTAYDTFREERFNFTTKDSGRSTQTSCCCTTICKNRWTLAFGIFGVVFFVMAFLMLLDYDDIQKCALTSGCYFAGLILSCMFFLLAPAVKYVCKYEGFINANPIFIALKLVVIACGDRCCCYGSNLRGDYMGMGGEKDQESAGNRKDDFEKDSKEKGVVEGNGNNKDYCIRVTNYREYASKKTQEDMKALLYSLCNDLVGLLTVFVATFLTHVNSRFKIATVTVDNPWVLWPIMFLKPLFAVGKMFWTYYDIRAKQGCSWNLRVVAAGGIVYVALLVTFYALAYDDDFNCKVCPQFFNNGTLCG